MLSKIGLFHPSARLETKILFEKKRERKKERKQEGKKRMVKTSLFGKTFHLELQRSCTSDKREKENKCTDRPKKKKSKKAPVSWRSKVTRKKNKLGNSSGEKNASIRFHLKRWLGTFVTWGDICAICRIQFTQYQLPTPAATRREREFDTAGLSSVLTRC